MEKIITQTPELTALFPPQTAGHHMITEIPLFSKLATSREVVDILNDAKSKYKSINYIYVVNSKGQLQGVISIKEIMQAKPREKLEHIMQKNIITVNPMAAVHKVALLCLRHHLKMIPIVDHKNRLLGAFSSDGLLEILNRDFSNDLLRLSGISFPQRHFHFDGSKIFWKRLHWMLVGMIGGLVTGAIIGAFKESIEAVVLLAVFIPVIMSTGATSANQSAMIFIRNLIHGDIKNWNRYVLNEIKIASMLALGMGILVFLIIWLFWANPALSLAVSISLFLTIIAGALIGVLAPMVINYAKQDPAIGAGPFLTIIKDIVAMSIYFSVATFLLAILGG